MLPRSRHGQRRRRRHPTPQLAAGRWCTRRPWQRPSEGACVLARTERKPRGATRMRSKRRRAGTTRCVRVCWSSGAPHGGAGKCGVFFCFLLVWVWVREGGRGGGVFFCLFFLFIASALCERLFVHMPTRASGSVEQKKMVDECVSCFFFFVVFNWPPAHASWALRQQALVPRRHRRKRRRQSSSEATLRRVEAPTQQRHPEPEPVPVPVPVPKGSRPKSSRACVAAKADKKGKERNTCQYGVNTGNSNKHTR